jgi:hypothetical protein
MVTTLLGSEISSSQWDFFFHFPLVPNVFPNMFSIAHYFYPICFGKYCPPFICFCGAKEKELKIEPSILWSLHSFIIF